MLANFILKYTILGEEQNGEEATPMIDECWVLHVDSSSNTKGLGARLILTSPDGAVAEYALWFRFFASNNKAEYEALVTDLRMVKELRVWHLRVHSDSQLVVSQVQGEYEVKEPNMIKYL